NLELSVHRLLALLLDQTRDRRPNVYWGLVDAGAREFEGAPDPMAILALARNAWVNGLSEIGRNYLMELPSAIASRFGQGHDTSLRIQSISNLTMLSDIVAELAIESGSFDDIRLVAELTRDMLGRIAATSNGNIRSSGFIAPSTEELSRLG